MSESAVCATRNRSLNTLSSVRSCPLPADTLILLPSASALTTTELPLVYVNSNLSAYLCRLTQASYISTVPHSAPVASLLPSGFQPSAETVYRLGTCLVPASTHPPLCCE